MNESLFTLNIFAWVSLTGCFSHLKQMKIFSNANSNAFLSSLHLQREKHLTLNVTFSRLKWMKRGKFILVVATHNRRRDVTWKTFVSHVFFFAVVADDQWTEHAHIKGPISVNGCGNLRFFIFVSLTSYDNEN